MLRIDVHALPDGLHEQTLRPDPEALGLDPEVFGEIVVDVRLDVADRRVLAAFDARAVATLECDRTAVEYRQPVAGRHTLLFASPSVLPPGAEPDEGVVPLPDDATSIDLTAPVRDTLVLALPVRRVAPGAEDVEIPTVFGADLDADGRPLDPRWEALRRLRDDDPA